MNSITHYFPDKETALAMIAAGKKKYEHDKRFVIDNNWPRGTFKGINYIDNALAAIMYATGKEPAMHDLNTPSETYGWTFDETRDILNALDSLSRGNKWYWNLYYEQTAVAI